jgi:hypothetical protein
MRARRAFIRVFGVAAAAVSLLAAARPIQAQDLPLAQLLPDLILREIVLLRPTIPVLSHAAHFSPIEANELQNPVVGIVQSFNTQMATQFATFPLGSSTGGLTYVFDESVGTFRRASSSFGPLFGERALTIGRGKLNAGVNYQHTSYDTFEGQDLDNGSIKFYLRHQDCCTVVSSPAPPGFVLTEDPNDTRFNPPFEGDLIEAALSLDATTHTTAAFANFGLTDRWDIGLAVPFVSVSLNADVTARIIRLVTCAEPATCNLQVHTFDRADPNAPLILRRSGSAAGLGDIALRSKYHFLSAPGGGLAAAVDVRLPTGDENELLGAGGVQAKFLLVASSERGRFGQHANVGYTIGEGDVAGTLQGLTAAQLPDEFNYSGGVEFVANPRVTVLGDLIGRTLRGAGRLEVAAKEFQYVDVTTLAPRPECGFPDFVCRSSVSFDEFDPRAGDLTLVLGTAGVKVNPFGNWLVSASVLFPLTDAGLRSRATTVVGLDYAF